MIRLKIMGSIVPRMLEEPTSIRMDTPNYKPQAYRVTHLQEEYHSAIRSRPSCPTCIPILRSSIR